MQMLSATRSPLPSLDFLYPQGRLPRVPRQLARQPIRPHRAFNTSVQLKQPDDEPSQAPIKITLQVRQAVATIRDMVEQLPTRRDELFENRMINLLRDLIDSDGIQFLPWNETIEPLLQWLQQIDSPNIGTATLRLGIHISESGLSPPDTDMQSVIGWGLAVTDNYSYAKLLVIEYLKTGRYTSCETMIKFLVTKGDYMRALEFYHLRLRYAYVTSPFILRRDAFVNLILESAPGRVELLPLLRKIINDENQRAVSLFASRLFMYYYKKDDPATAIDVLELSAANGLVLDPDVYTAGFRIYEQRGDAKFAVDLLETLDYFGINPSITFYNSAMNVKYQQRFTDDVEKLYKEIRKKGLKPDEKTYNFLMHAFARRGEIKRVILLFTEVERELGQTNGFHYSAVLLAASVAQDHSMLYEWFERLQKDAKVEVGLSHYNIMIDACARTVDAEGALNLLDEMMERGIDPNVITWTTVIALYSYRHDSDTAQSVFDRMESSGILPNIITYGALMNAYVNCENMDAVLLILDEVEKSDLETNSIIYNIVLKGYGLTRNIAGVRRVFDHMLRLGLQPDLYTYTGIINALCEHGSVAEADSVLEKMIQERVTPNVFTYSALMDGHLRTGNSQRARELYAEMLERGIKPSYVTFSILNAAYSSGESDNEGLASAEKILQSLIVEAQSVDKAGTLDSTTGGVPSTIDTDALASLHGKVPTDIFNPIINAYGKRYRPDLARNLYNIMLEVGTPPDAQTHTILMNAYRLGQDFEGVKDTWRNVLRTVDKTCGSRLSEAVEQQSLDELKRPVLQKCETIPPPIAPLHADAMRYPLSIYAEALEGAQLYEDILLAWNAVIGAGFDPDAQNWNQLARALIGAGRMEEACLVIDRHLFASMDETEQRSDADIADPAESTTQFTTSPVSVHLDRAQRWSPYFPHEATMASLEIAMGDLRRGRLLSGRDGSKLLLDPLEAQNLPVDSTTAARRIYTLLHERYPRVADALVNRRTNLLGKAMRNRFTGQT